MLASSGGLKVRRSQLNDAKPNQGKAHAAKAWRVTLQHAGTRKTREMTMPGGLQEAEARRAAARKAGAYWLPVAASLSVE